MQCFYKTPKLKIVNEFYLFETFLEKLINYFKVKLSHDIINFLLKKKNSIL